MELKWLPNCLTLLRCALAPVAAWVILTGTPMAALMVFVAVALTDFIDGFAARKLNAVSGFGAFLDPVADKLLVAFALLALCAAHQWSLALLLPTLVIIARDLGVTLLRLRPGTKLPVTRAAKWKTATEMGGIVTLLLAALVGNGAVEVAGLAIVALAAALSAYTGALYAIAALGLNRNDRA